LLPETDGLIFVYTGEGCVDCSTTVGHALSAMAAGQRVFMAQFGRSGWDPVLTILEGFSETVVSRHYINGPTEEALPDDLRNAQAGLAEIQQALCSGDYSPVILDGANRAVCFGLLSVGDLLTLIGRKPKHVQLIITGACADPRIIQRADRVIEMNRVKDVARSAKKIEGG